MLKFALRAFGWRGCESDGKAIEKSQIIREKIRKKEEVVLRTK
jgi:hypothetical protein